MKRILLTLLALVVVIGLFSTVGYAGYRFGYARGMQATTQGDTVRPGPGLRPFDGFGPRGLRLHDFRSGREIPRGFGDFPGTGSGFFLFRWLFWLAALGLVIGLISWLFTRSGWRLVRETNPPVARTEPEPPKTEHE